ncbi:hypothetical protein WA1_39520 [Scytonema hofmannii PCC 7110]|uniref:Uncharacterized protein n=1 Tax=Scytonema hofmannii PCC 7110 TaxID=128403 RepID=A0A139WYV9_9CYAN|nr:hypothetical protein [Scytonema hofmannii]KYC37562.1 hypothetical protein WA1_39520 [Scytonema hofmannii PCC 7110]
MCLATTNTVSQNISAILQDLPRYAEFLVNSSQPPTPSPTGRGGFLVADRSLVTDRWLLVTAHWLLVTAHW